MIPKKFKEQNVIFAENQSEYLPLPAHKSENGEVITCWGLTWKERLRILIKGELFLCVSTFNHPLQPIFLTTDKSDIFVEQITHP